METTNSKDLPSNQFAAITAGSVIKCDDNCKEVQQDMLAKAKRFALNHFGRPDAFYHDVGMCFVAQNGDKFGWVGAQEVADEPNVCFIQLCRVMSPM